MEQNNIDFEKIFDEIRDDLASADCKKSQILEKISIIESAFYQQKCKIKVLIASAKNMARMENV